MNKPLERRLELRKFSLPMSERQNGWPLSARHKYLPEKVLVRSVKMIEQTVVKGSWNDDRT
ncbi:MAG: hypothetical protein MKZ90_08295 [Pseudomonadales bacterium]|nr:hypothetical protein [Pseudomonadales bacterium]